MALHPFRIVNVFTREGAQLSGNSLCVFENGDGLDARTMQALALQFNLSETTFVLPSSTADARVRIFTPNYELGFAGHPTLGTAHVCRSLGLGGDAVRLELQAGIVPVTAAGNRWTLTAPPVTFRELDVSRPLLARALALDTDDIDEGPLWVKAGTEQLIVPLKSLDAVSRASPRMEAFAGIQSDEGHGMAYIFAPSGVDQFQARFFFPQGNAMLEDPATGSATANFGGWCLAMQRVLPIRYQIAQGDMVGRPSTLHLEVDTARHIRVGGNVAEVARGVVTLD